MESKEHDDFSGFTKEDFDALDKHEEEYAARQNAVPDHDEKPWFERDEPDHDHDHER